MVKDFRKWKLYDFSIINDYERLKRGGAEIFDKHSFFHGPHLTFFRENGLILMEVDHV